MNEHNEHDNHEYFGCSNPNVDYEKLEKLGEGTFGEVYKAKQKNTNQIVAIKKIFHHNEKEGFPLTALREMGILKNLDHENIIEVVDMAYEPSSNSSGSISEKKPLAFSKGPSSSSLLPTAGVWSMVTPYMDHDLCGLLQNPKVKLKIEHVKCYLKQILQGIDYMHQQGYLHRDIKTANILINDWGIVKLADFGLARKYYGQPPDALKGAGEGQHRYTQMVVTRWYRPIELIIGMEQYTTAIDMWGIGCVFGEMFLKRPILPGASDMEQGDLIVKMMGPPDEDTKAYFKNLPLVGQVKWEVARRQLDAVFGPLAPSDAVSLMSGLLNLNPLKRLTAVGALSHEFFKNDPPPSKPGQVPIFPTSHEMSSKQKNVPLAPNVDRFEHKNESGGGEWQVRNNNHHRSFRNNYDHGFGNHQRNNYHNNHYHHHDNNNNNNYHNNNNRYNNNRGGMRFHNKRGGYRGRGGGRPQPYNNRHDRNNNINEHKDKAPTPPYRKKANNTNNEPAPRPPYASNTRRPPPPPSALPYDDDV